MDQANNARSRYDARTRGVRREILLALALTLGAVGFTAAALYTSQDSRGGIERR